MKEIALNLKKELESILISLGIENPKVILTHPENLDFGDYTSNCALIYSKNLHDKPFILAEKIVNLLKEKSIPHIEDIKIAGSGFINIFCDRNFFSQSLNDISYEKVLNDKKIIIEYTNTNVLKPLHIGHLMGNVIGESISRIFEISGAEVKRNTYQGDVGLHVAKAVWGIMQMKKDMPEKDLSLQSEFIGKAYANGAEKYETDDDIASEIKEINKKIFDKSDKEINSLYEWGRDISLKHFDVLYKKLGTKFDYLFFESEVASDAVKIVTEFAKKGVFEESDGAYVFKGEKRDPKLHTRVFLNSQGLPTYEAKDIAHAIRKYKKYEADLSVIVTANEQDDYFKVMLEALSEIEPEIASKTKHISHGLLRLTTGKMSSRKGNVITGEDLINEMEGKALEKNPSKDIAEKVAISAIKYSILKQSFSNNIVFDPEKSLSFEGDSGPYLQYTVVRSGAILNKAEGLGIKIKNNIVPAEITNLEKLLYRFPEVVKRSCDEFSPHYIASFLVQIAGEFNSWYGNVQIIDEKDPYTPYRLFIVKKTKEILEQGLNLLGIDIPERM